MTSSTPTVTLPGVNPADLAADPSIPTDPAERAERYAAVASDPDSVSVVAESLAMGEEFGDEEATADVDVLLGDAAAGNPDAELIADALGEVESELDGFGEDDSDGEI